MSRPTGLVTPAVPVTIPDPNGAAAIASRELEMAMRAEERRIGRIEYAPAATPRQLDQIRLELELNRQARNRNVKAVRR